MEQIKFLMGDEGLPYMGSMELPKIGAKRYRPLTIHAKIFKHFLGVQRSETAITPHRSAARIPPANPEWWIDSDLPRSSCE